MTDKQIIIEGVDVSGCKCFYINDSHPERKECINPYCKGLCKENPNCYYKQLKRAEDQIVDLNKMVQTKEQECSKYKKAIEDIENICVVQNLKYDTIACEILDVIEKMCEEIIDERL